MFYFFLFFEILTSCIRIIPLKVIFVAFESTNLALYHATPVYVRTLWKEVLSEKVIEFYKKIKPR